MKPEAECTIDPVEEFETTLLGYRLAHAKMRVGLVSPEVVLTRFNDLGKAANMYGLAIIDRLRTAEAEVKAHDAARWRVPTAEDWESDDQQYVVCRDRGRKPWERANYYNLKHFKECFHAYFFDGMEIMVADPIPLPELPKVTP